jgi:hypothetical protein
LPREDTTPPVMKTKRVMGPGVSGRSDGKTILLLARLKAG